MMLFHTGKLRLLAVATTMLASMSFISAASAAGPTYALVQINQQALFFNLMNKGAQDAAKASGKDLVIFNSNDNPVAQNDAIENYIFTKQGCYWCYSLRPISWLAKISRKISLGYC